MLSVLCRSISRCSISSSSSSRCSISSRCSSSNRCSSSSSSSISRCSSSSISIFPVQKVLPWAAPLQSCWVSSVAGPADGGPGSPQTCWSSSAGRRRSGPAATVLGFRSRRLHSSAVRQKKRPQPEPLPRELDLLRYDMKDLWKGPKPALVLGFAGLIPFAAPTLIMCSSELYIPELAYAQLAYGAAIVSFLGGARWGFTLPESSPARPDWINLANSVVPGLIGCGAVLMSDAYVSAATMIIMGLGISLHYDLSLLPTYPAWLKALRAVLTTVAVLSVVGTLIMNGSYPEKRIFSD